MKQYLGEMSSSVVGELIKSQLMIESEDMNHLLRLGERIGKLYTDDGLPIDIALQSPSIPSDSRLLVLYGACKWLIEHKRRSGATEKAIERQRMVNRRAIESFINFGECKIY